MSEWPLPVKSSRPPIRQFAPASGSMVDPSMPSRAFVVTECVLLDASRIVDANRVSSISHATFSPVRKLRNTRSGLPSPLKSPVPCKRQSVDAAYPTLQEPTCTLACTNHLRPSAVAVLYQMRSSYPSLSMSAVAPIYQFVSGCGGNAIGRCTPPLSTGRGLLPVCGLR